MKKKMLSLAAGMCVTALLLTGCSSEISNDYVTISKYKGVEVEKVKDVKITDELVDKEIQALLEDEATTIEVKDRAAKDGDIVNIDFVGKMDGVAFDNGSAKNQECEIGSDTYIDGFEAGIIGHSIGETFDLNLKFPEVYPQSPDKAGKDCVFTITLNGIKEKVVPELTDELVQEFSDTAKTVEEYRSEVKKQMEEYVKSTNETKLRENVTKAIMDNTQVTKYPKDRLKNMQEKIHAQYEEMAEYYNLEFEEFLTQYMNMTEETFNSQLIKAAKDQIKQQMAMELIAEKAEIDVSDKVLEKRYEQFAVDYGFESVEELKKVMKDNESEEDLKAMAVTEEVMEWLIENCKQVEKKADGSSSNK